jgi:quercetin dioxygenase-like cupin family protein
MNNEIKTLSIIVVTTSVFGITACNDYKNKTKMDTETNASIFPKGEKLSNEWFSGEAFLSPLVAQDNNNNFSAGAVTFEPGARTNWHTHPKGQVLIVIEGNGLYQEKGKTAQVIKKGEVVNIPAYVEHWHGARANSKMVHIAITNYKDGVQVTWLQPVSDEQYNEVNN